MRERGKYRVAALLDQRYQVRTLAGEWLGILWATRVAHRAMRFGLSDGTTAVYPTDAPLFSRQLKEQQTARRTGPDDQARRDERDERFDTVAR